jgi:diguanylate cyclase (GGDEF)-like protein
VSSRSGRWPTSARTRSPEALKRSKSNRAKAAIAVACTLGALSVASIVTLQDRASASRDAQVKLALVINDVNALQGLPWKADPGSGGSPALAGALMSQTERRVDATLGQLRRTHPVPELAAAERPWKANAAVLEQVRALVVRKDLEGAGYVQYKAQPFADQALSILRKASSSYRARSSLALRDASIGSAVTIVLLLAAFVSFHLRLLRPRALSERLAEENQRLLDASREDAVTDPLTGLGNRRALLQDLGDRLPPSPGVKVMLGIFDLDGFKTYNDNFGHVAGDELLARLGGRLATTGIGTAYRLGGDELCVLSPVDRDGAAIARLAAAALSEHGDAFEVGCSYGVVLLPDEATTGEAALAIADQRMYAQKASGRMSAGRQSADVLMKVLGEQDTYFEQHMSGVAELAERMAEQLGQPQSEIRSVRLAAELHDVGKATGACRAAPAPHVSSAGIR